eukprot:127835-Amphidinium_carterae.1
MQTSGLRRLLSPVEHISHDMVPEPQALAQGIAIDAIYASTQPHLCAAKTAKPCASNSARLH